MISPKTVANHIEHTYAKIDASTRAAASLFAMQHGLLPEEEFVQFSPAEELKIVGAAIKKNVQAMMQSA